MTFGVLVFPQVEELDFAGPWEMVTMWHQVAGGPSAVVVAETSAPLDCAKGLRIVPHVGFADCPPLDYLLVPGGQGTRREVDNPALIGFIRERAPHCRALLSVCTGAFLLHAAGSLGGRRCTTHWGSLQRLRALGDVTVVEDRFVHDDRIWTSAGVSAGIDMTLQFIADAAGDDAAAKVQFAAEYYPLARRYGRYADEHPQAPAYARSAAAPSPGGSPAGLPAGGDR